MSGRLGAERFEPKHETPVAAAPGVTRVTCDNSGPLTGDGTNSYIVGGSRCLVVDPGPDDSGHAEALRAALAGRAVAGVLVTHRHRDHAGGATAFARSVSAPTLAFDAAAMRRQGSERLGVDTSFTPDESIVDGWTWIEDGVSVAAVFTPGHGADHLAFRVEAEGGNVILSGDHVMGWSTTVIAPPYGHMGDFLASVRRLLALPEATLLPGHGGPIIKAHSHMRALLKHRENRERLVLKAVQAGHETVGAVAKAAYPELPEGMMPAAALSTLAHLEHLEEEGAVTREGERYRV